MENENWTGGTEEEYETQHFGFGAQRFKISVRQMIEQKIRAGVKDLESYLKEGLDLNDTDKATLSRACDRLLQLYFDRAVSSLKNIDDEIDRILKVPSNVLLPKDEVQQRQTTEKEYEDLKVEVTNLRKRVERGALMEALLTAEVDEISSIEKVCDLATKDMEVLDLLHEKFQKGDYLKTVPNDTLFLRACVPFIKDEESIFEN